MYGYIYLTLNKTNDKKYIGMHKHQEFDPDYYGSGILLTRSLNSHGKDNFSVEVLEWCKTKEELYEAEKKWISKFDAVNSDEFYNIAAGGDGGDTTSGYSLKQKEEYKIKLSNSVRNAYTPEKRQEHSELMHDVMISMNLKRNDETKKKISDSCKKRWEDSLYREHMSNIHKGIEPWHKGRTGVYSEETRKQMSESAKARGANNKGYININDGVNTRSINKDDLKEYLSNGWVVGRSPKDIECMARGHRGIKHKTHRCPTKGKIAVYKDNKRKYINPDDLEIIQKEGWDIWRKN